YTGAEKTRPEIKAKISGSSSISENIEFKINESGDMLTITLKIESSGTKPAAAPSDIAAAWDKFAGPGQFDIQVAGDGSEDVTSSSQEMVLEYSQPSEKTLGDLKEGRSDLYHRIKAELDKQRVELPPASAVAGVYARVDRNHGVWKAPANEALSAVIGPTVKITDADQENLNIDPAGAGKSINAIRGFTGRGTMVWGARTLDGGSNEWRYISVRRLFNMVEESIRKSTVFAVFGPNDQMNWLKVKAMIESYLEGLWRQGALAGAEPQQAFFVNVGLGKTMTSQDILEGRMIVEVGIAAVRPAEFIILRFSHKMQEAA
ncbi:MAG: phage tail sheath family protein, partial [Desulfobacterales bacterium]|nr:phage tail sheath family protein [Desulfobacterales bacterium]